MARYSTVRLVRRAEEEKYGMVRYGTVRYGHLGSTATPYSKPYQISDIQYIFFYLFCYGV